MRAIKKADPLPSIPKEFSDNTFEIGIRFYPEWKKIKLIGHRILAMVPPPFHLPLEALVPEKLIAESWIHLTVRLLGWCLISRFSLQLDGSKCGPVNDSLFIFFFNFLKKYPSCQFFGRPLGSFTWEVDTTLKWLPSGRCYQNDWPWCPVPILWLRIAMS